MHQKFHTQNEAVHAKPIKNICRLAIKQIDTILNSKETVHYMPTEITHPFFLRDFKCEVAENS